MNLDQCETVFDAATRSNTEAEFCHAIEPLFQHYKILSFDWGAASIFWKARRCDNVLRFENVRDVGCKRANVGAGRVNDAGEPTLYLATTFETTIREVRATPGDRLHVAGFYRPDSSPLRLIAVGEYSSVHRTGRVSFAGTDPGRTITTLMNTMPRHEAFTAIYIDQFFAHVLSDPQASSNEYKFSRALARSLYARNGADGIIYPSVQYAGGVNIAVKPDAADRAFRNVRSFTLRVGKVRRYGVADFEFENVATGVDEFGNFHWDAEPDCERGYLYNMTKLEFDAYENASLANGK